MDEYGFQELESTKGKVFGTALIKKVYLITIDASTWVSIIECSTAEGKRLSLVVIFTGASLQGQWFPDYIDRKLKGWKYDYSLTGWNNTRIAL